MTKIKAGLPTCPIHDRKAPTMTPLRERVLEIINPMLLPDGPKQRRITIRKDGRSVHMIIRPLSWMNNMRRKIFEVTMTVAHRIRTISGKIKTIIHSFTIEYCIPFAEIPIPGLSGSAKI